MRILAALLIVLFLYVPAFAGGFQATSGVTVDTLITAIRSDLDESTAGFWSDSDFVKWIDQAVREINYRARVLESGASNIILQSNTWSYSLSGSYMDVEKVMYDSGDTTSAVQVYDLNRAPFRMLRYGHEKDRGTPKNFAVWNDTLFIWPIPRSDISGTTLYLYAVSTPTGVSSTTDAIETPAYFDKAIKMYVKAHAYWKDQMWEAGTNQMALFRDYINVYLVRWGLVPTETPTQ